LILRTQRVIHLRVEPVRRLLADLCLLEVDLAKRGARDVRQRNELEQVLRDRADAVRRDDVAVKGRSAAAVAVSATEE